MEIKGSFSWISMHFNSFRYYQMKMYIVTSWEWAYMDKRTWGLFLKQYLLLWGSEKILSTEQCQVKLKLWPKIEKLVQHQTHDQTQKCWISYLTTYLQKDTEEILDKLSAQM